MTYMNTLGYAPVYTAIPLISTAGGPFPVSAQWRYYEQEAVGHYSRWDCPYCKRNNPPEKENCLGCGAGRIAKKVSCDER